MRSSGSGWAIRPLSIATPPEVAYQVDPDWSFIDGYYEVAANWVLIRENVMDLTHIAFLHKNTFNQNDWVTPPDHYMEGDTVCYEQDFDLAALSPLFCAGMGLPEDKPIKRAQKGRMPSFGHLVFGLGRA